MKIHFFLLSISMIFLTICNAQKFPCNFYDRHKYRFTLFNTGFIDQTTKQEPYTGNATGFTNPLN